MTDLTERRGAGHRISYSGLLWQRSLLVLALLAITCGVVAEQAREDECKRVIGRLAVAMKLDSYYSNCQCMKRSLDFSDACNSVYFPLL